MVTGWEFPWKSEEDWPRNPSSLGYFQDGDPEVRMVYKVCHASVSELAHPLVSELSSMSSWHRLKKSVAWFLWYLGHLQRLSKRWNSREPIQLTLILSLPPIAIMEMEIAELEILRNTQQFNFPEELQVKKSSSVRSLDPTLVNSVLLVGGRLSLASTVFDAKHQIILPKKDHVSNLVVEYYHQISSHSGREYIVSLSCEKFWIINISSVVRKVLSRCFSCWRCQGPFCERKMADPPVDLLTPGQLPLTFVGIDCFGPLQVCRGQTLVKRYEVIFRVSCYPHSTH